MGVDRTRWHRVYSSGPRTVQSPSLTVPRTVLVLCDVVVTTAMGALLPQKPRMHSGSLGGRTLAPPATSDV